MVIVQKYHASTPVVKTVQTKVTPCIKSTKHTEMLWKTFNNMNWNQRYANDNSLYDFSNFYEKFNSDADKYNKGKAEEYENYHNGMTDYHTESADQHYEGDTDHKIHKLAANAHALAAEAWNHVWNHIETPNEKYKEYNDAMKDSLIKHANNLTQHAYSISGMIDEE